MAKAVHAMIRVLDEQRSIDFYKRAFGLTVADRYVFDSFTLIISEMTRATSNSN